MASRAVIDMVERTLLPVLDSIDAEIKSINSKLDSIEGKLVPIHGSVQNSKVKSTTAKLSSKN